MPQRNRGGKIFVPTEELHRWKANRFVLPSDEETQASEALGTLETRVKCAAENHEVIEDLCLPIYDLPSPLRHPRQPGIIQIPLPLQEMGFYSLEKIKQRLQLRSQGFGMKLKTGDQIEAHILNSRAPRPSPYLPLRSRHPGIHVSWQETGRLFSRGNEQNSLRGDPSTDLWGLPCNMAGSPSDYIK